MRSALYKKHDGGAAAHYTPYQRHRLGTGRFVAVIIQKKKRAMYFFVRSLSAVVKEACGVFFFPRCRLEERKKEKKKKFEFELLSRTGLIIADTAQSR